MVRGGIIGARVKAEGDLHAPYILDSAVKVAGNLVVRSYIQNSGVEVGLKATVQGEEAGDRQLCLLGGDLAATLAVDAASIGSELGGVTRVTVGVDPAVEASLAKYTKGQSFADIRLQRAMRSLQTYVPSVSEREAVLAALRRGPATRRELLQSLLKEVATMRKLKKSLADQLKELQVERLETASRARIWVRRTAYERVTIQIGEAHTTLSAPVEQAVFRQDETRERVVHTSLS